MCLIVKDSNTFLLVPPHKAFVEFGKKMKGCATALSTSAQRRRVDFLQALLIASGKLFIGVLTCWRKPSRVHLVVEANS